MQLYVLVYWSSGSTSDVLGAAYGNVKADAWMAFYSANVGNLKDNYLKSYRKVCISKNETPDPAHVPTVEEFKRHCYAKEYEGYDVEKVSIYRSDV